MAEESANSFSVSADAVGSPTGSQQLRSTTADDSGSSTTDTSRILKSEQKASPTEERKTSTKLQIIFKTTTARADEDTKLLLQSQKIASDEKTGDSDGPNANSSTNYRQNKHNHTHKRRGSTDLLLIAAAQKEARDSKKSANRNVKKVKKEKIPSPTKASGKSKGTPRPHVYHDYSAVPDATGYSRKKTGGVSIPFPEKLMEMLKESSTNSSIVSWLPHGRAFIVRKPKEFSETIMHKYFRQTKITSFQRQLNLYGFRRLTQGPDAGAYYHEMFLRGRMQLAARMTRQKVKGIGHKQPSHRESEPNLYALPHLPEDSPSKDAAKLSNEGIDNDMNIDCAHSLMAGLHQTPATATKYYHPSTIAAAARNNSSTMATCASPPLASPAIQAAQLLKSMATAKVTPGSFPTMLTWAPTSNSSSSLSGGGGGGGATSLLPPPPPLHVEKPTSCGAHDTEHDKQTNKGTSTGRYRSTDASKVTCDSADSTTRSNVTCNDNGNDGRRNDLPMPSISVGVPRL